MTPRDLDEDDVRVRPRPGSRPRTRNRPAHESATSATVIAVDRGRYTARTDAGATVVAVRGGEMRRTAVVVGDRVDVVGDVSGTPDTLTRIVRIAPRVSLLRRTPDDTDPVERPVVANADVMVVVTALADPEPRPRMIDRCLVAAYDGGLKPLLCLTKSDLASPDSLIEAYAPLGIDVVVTGRGNDNLDELLAAIRGRTSVFFGHSGVGKSTLVNRLVPTADRAVSHVNDVTGRGRHTTSAAIALELPGGGWVIDTPGVRSFGLGAVTADRVVHAFPDLADAAEECPVGCSHRGPECALDQHVEQGGATAARLDSLRRILSTLDGSEADGAEE